MNKPLAARNPALDVIRCIGLFFIISSHFFTHAGFGFETVVGKRMFLILVFHDLFLTCVPMYVMLSGYLMKNKKLSAQYYSKIWKTLVIYVLASICCGIFSAMQARLNGGEPFTFGDFLRGCLDYKLPSYGWYIEMYIGLFLLIPFLNVLYNNLESQKQKQILILTLLCFTALPSVVNVYCVADLSFWKNPSSSSAYDSLIPSWWTGIYPLTYYFIGAYLREYPLKMKRSTNILLILAAILAGGGYYYYRSHGSLFVWGPWQDSESLTIALPAIALFNFLSQLDLRRIGEKAARFLSYLSDLCLGAYLVTWIFDRVYYPILAQIEPVVPYRYKYLPVVVTAIFVSSLALSAVLNGVYHLLEKTVSQLPVSKTRRS